MRKVLAIDDKHDNLVTISAFIKTYIEDCSVVLAQSGREGIEKALSGQPDTIVLDIKMPEMDGYEVCKRLKENPATKHIPIILLTAIKTDVDSRIKGLEIGADAFLTKPIDEVELTAQINVMLRIKKSEDLLRAERDLLEVEVKKRTESLMQSESALRKERDFIRSLSDASPAYFIALHETGEISFMNRALSELLGCEFNNDCNGQLFIDFVFEGDRDITQEHIGRLANDDLIISFENRLMALNDQEALVEWHGRYFQSDDSDDGFVFFVGIDITEK